jgi:hypothetical protein
MLLFVLAFTISLLVFAYCFCRFMGTTDTFDLAAVMREINAQRPPPKQATKATAVGRK